MVHDSRRVVHNRHAVILFAETSVLSHGISDFICLGVIYDPIADCVSHREFADFQIPAGDIELRAEERRPLAISWLDDFEKILSNP